MKIRIHTAHTLPDRHSAAKSAEYRSWAGARPRASAFTLVETVVATLLATIMLSAFYGGLGSGFSMTQVARENLRATQIILQRMEGIRLLPYNSFTNSASYPAKFTDYYCPSATNLAAAGVPYTVTYNCTPAPTTLPPSYRSNMLCVTITASWTSGKVQRTRSMETYIARHGIQPYVSDVTGN
jgi:Tfp pilus assembly protein PilV